ncbi:MAG: mannose-6-phosphate isomerase, class I [Lachnospiraceae bacterium]
MKPIFLKPVLKHNIWGGTKLRDEFHYEVEGDDIGECWGIAAHTNGDCEVIFEGYEGDTLSSLWKNHPELFGKTKEETQKVVFPLLIKIIDAKDDLSIQVHPDDAYAMKYENGSLGKTECWYILGCEEDATLVIGHNAKTREELAQMIEAGAWSDLISEIHVKKGDFIQIDPGMVHAIKGGITLLETQQNSDITYRVYDYDRLSNGQPRELHIEKSIDVITVPSMKEEGVIDTTNTPYNKLNKLYACEYYQVFELKVKESFAFEKEASYMLMSVVDGSGMIDGIAIKKGDHFILPLGMADTMLTGDMTIIASTE